MWSLRCLLDEMDRGCAQCYPRPNAYSGPLTVSFETLIVIVLAGLGGPLLGVAGRRFVPVVIGEILAGVLVGPAGAGRGGPRERDGCVPRGNRLRDADAHGWDAPAAARGAARPLRCAAAELLAAIVVRARDPGGLLAASIAGTGHAAVYVVLLASGSAAVLLPALEETGIDGPDVMTVMAQVTIADVDHDPLRADRAQPGRVGHAVLGARWWRRGCCCCLALARLLGRPWVGAPCAPAL